MKETPTNQPYFCKACQLPASGCECGKSQTPKLKPCPFCGKPAILKIEDDHHGEFFELGCPDKECVGNWAFYTEPIENLDASVKAWNTRAESELLTAANEMEEALKDLIEHIDACNESDLLNCDDDPHPPSVFRCYADLAQAKLDRFRALKPKGGER